MIDFKLEFAKLLAQETGIDINEIIDLIEIPPESKFGDYAFPCFSLAKVFRKNPNQIAEELADKIKSDNFEKFQAVGAYLNVFVNKTEFISAIFEGKDEVGIKKEKVLVEFLSANPNKPLHIGQARNVGIGDTMVKIYKHLGYRTDAANYGDDSGVNVGYNIVGHMYYNIPLETDKKFDHYCGDIYYQMKQKDDEEFKKLLSETLLKIEHGSDEKVNKLHYDYTRKCTIAQFKSCWRLNSYFDLINWETSIMHLHLFEDNVHLLKEKGYVYFVEEGEDKGCWVIDLSNFEEFKNQDKKTQILIKSDGVATYTAKDIVYAMWKLGYLERDFYYNILVKQLNGKVIYSTSADPKDNEKVDFGDYNISVAVIDNRQSHPQKVVKGSLEQLGYLNDNKQYIHLPYGVVHVTPKTLKSLGFDLSEEEINMKKLPFSSRKGWVVTLDQTFDLLKEKALEETKLRNLNAEEEWLADTAEKIALSSFRFFLIRTDINKDITFDLDDALDMESETGAYVLYTYARISGILRKSEIDEKDLVSKFKPECLTEDIEFQMTKLIADFDKIVNEAKDNLAPYLLCRYLIDLCKIFNSFYAKVHVLKAEDDVKFARLNLLLKLKQTLKDAMNLVGMKELETM